MDTFSSYKLIYLYRHGETNWNVEDGITGQLENIDIYFTEFGSKQINEISEDIRKNKIEIIYSSDLSRAIETAQIIAKEKCIEVDDRLLERGWGNENRDGKETDDEAKSRFEKFLRDILEKYSNKRILLVTHGSLIKLAQDVIENNCIERERVNNCTIIKYNKNKDKEIMKV